MNDEQRTISAEQYFQQYREKMRRLDDLKDRKQILEENYRKDRRYLDEQLSVMGQDVSNMRRVITKIIDEGIDPTTAKLSMDESCINDMWHGNNDMRIMTVDDGTYTVDLADTTSSIFSMGNIGVGVATTGATGAIGALGVMGPYYGSGSPGANGPSGYSSIQTGGSDGVEDLYS